MTTSTTSRIITTVAFAAIAILSNNANAQNVNAQVVQPQYIPGAGQVIERSVETRVVPENIIVAPAPAPKLGFTGQIVYGLGMRVLTVNFGSPAQRAGLEHGDIIMSANGIQIRNQGDLSRALSNAVQYNNGVVNLYVKNIRGCSSRGNQYVNVTAHLFGQPIQGLQQVSSNQIIQN